MKSFPEDGASASHTKLDRGEFEKEGHDLFEPQHRPTDGIHVAHITALYLPERQGGRPLST